MSQITIPASVIEALAYNHDEEDIRTDYSGRSMYGRTCLGYTGGDPVMFTFNLAVEMVRADLEAEESEDEPEVYAVQEKLADLGEPRTDSMGRGAIFYWPGVTVGE